MSDVNKLETDSENNTKPSISPTSNKVHHIPDPVDSILEERSSEASDFESPTQFESDDEATLKEEEELTTEVDIANELEDLQAESELPIELLLQKYGLEKPASTSRNSEINKEAEQIHVSLADHSENGEFAGPSSPKKRRIEDTNGIMPNPGSDVQLSDGKNDNDPSNCSSNDSDSGSSDDSDFIPFVPLIMQPKEPRVGEEFQIEVKPACVTEAMDTETLPRYREDLAECLWSPTVLQSGDDVESHLRTTLRIPKSVKSVPDNVHWLHDVFKDNGNLKIPLPKLAQPSSKDPQFSSEDITAFENGLSEYGKNFTNIQKFFLPNKKVGDIVYFYYFWKKSERYDHFCTMYKLGRGRHLLDENITDFMYRLTNEIQSLPQQPINTKECPFTRSQSNAMNSQSVSSHHVTHPNYLSDAISITHREGVGGGTETSSKFLNENHASNLENCNSLISSSSDDSLFSSAGPTSSSSCPAVGGQNSLQIVAPTVLSDVSN